MMSQAISGAGIDGIRTATDTLRVVWMALLQDDFNPSRVEREALCNVVSDVVNVLDGVSQAERQRSKASGENHVQ